MAIKVRTAREIAEDRKKKEGKPPIKTTVYKMPAKKNTETETKKPAVTFKNTFMPQAQKPKTTNVLTINKSNMPTNSTKNTKTVSKDTQTATNTVNNVKTRIQQNKPQGAVEKNLGKMYIEPFAQKKLTADSTAKEILNIKKGPLEKPKKQSYNSAIQVKDVPYNKAVDAKKQKAVRDIKAKADTDILNNYNNAMKGLTKAQQDPNYYSFIESGRKLAGTGRDFDTMKEFKKLNPSLYKNETVLKTSPLNNGVNISANGGNDTKYTHEEKQTLDYLRGKYNTTKSDADLKEYETAKDIIDKGNKVNATKKKEFEGEMLRDPNAKANILNRRTALIEAEDKLNSALPNGVDRGKQDLSRYIDDVKKGVRAEDANLPLANAQGMLDYIAVVEKEKQALEAYSGYDLTLSAEQYHQKQKDIDRQITELEKSKYGLDAQALLETEKQIYNLRGEKDRAKTQWQISNNQELTDKEKAKVKEWESGVAGNLDGLAQQGKGWLQEQTAITGTQYDPFAHSGDSISEYSRATTKEKDIYAAIVAKYGFDAGNEWLKINAGEFAERKAKADAESLRNMENAGLQQAAILGNDFMAGLQTFTSGAQSAIRSIQGDTRPLQQTASNLVRGEIRPELTALAGFGSDFVYNTANMLPTVATSAINPWVGTALMGFTSYGNAVNESLSEGMRFDEAVSYGIMTGASEALLEKAIGGFATMGGLTKTAKGALSKIDDVIKKSVKNPKIVGAINVLVNQAVSSVGEFSEEYLQEILNPVFRNLAFGEDNEIKPFTQEALYAGLLGAVTSLGMNSASYGANYKNSINKQEVAEEIATTLGMDVGEVYKALGNPPEVKSKVKQLPNEIASVLSNGSAIINKTADGNERVKYEVLNSLNNVEKAFIVDAINKDIESRGGSLDKIVADYKQSYLSKNIPVTSKDVFDTLVASYIKDVYSGNTSLGDADVIINNKTALALYSRSFNGIGEDIGIVGLQGEGADLQSNNAINDDVRFSIQKDADGMPYVKVDDDILAGVPKSDWGRVTRDVLKTKFADGIEVGDKNIGVNKISRNEFTQSKYSQHLNKTNTPLLYKKYKIANNVDELLKAFNYKYEEPMHIRKDNIVGFYRGKATVEIGGKNYTGDVLTAELKNGKEIFYDVVNIKETPYTVDSKNKLTVETGVSSIKNIPQENLIVKEKNNVSDDDGLQRKSMQSTFGKSGEMESKSRAFEERRETTGGQETKQPTGRLVQIKDNKGQILFEGETKTPEGKAEYLRFASSYAKKGSIAGVKGAVIPTEIYTDGMTNLKEENASKGIETVFLTHATLDGSNVNGLTSKDTIYINVGSEYSIEAINSHEELHYKLKQNPTKARLLFEEVKSTLSTQELNKILGEYKQRYAGLIEGMSDKQATDYLIEEFLADVYGGMAKDSRISALIDGADLGVGGKGNKKSNDIKFSIDKSFKQQLNEIDEGTFDKSNSHVYVTETPAIFNKKANMPKLPIAMRYDAVFLAMKREGELKGNYHNLGTDIMSQIPKALEDPLLIYKNINTGRIETAIELKDKKGKNILLSIEMNTTGKFDGKHKAVNLVITAFGVKEQYYLKRMAENEFIYKKESTSQVNPRGQFPSVFNEIDSNKTVSQDDDKVNTEKPKYSIGEKETTSTTPNKTTKPTAPTLQDIPRKAQDYYNSKTNSLINKANKLFGIMPRDKVEFKARIREFTQDVFNEGGIDARNAQKLFEDLYQKGRVLDDAYLKEYQDLKKLIKDTPIDVSSLKNDVADFSAWRKSMFGKLKLANNGMKPDIFYKQLTEMYPEVFTEEIINSTDMVNAIAEVYNGITSKEYTNDEANGKDFKEYAKEQYARMLKDVLTEAQRAKAYYNETVRGSEDLGVIDEVSVDISYTRRDRAQKTLEQMDEKNLLTKIEKQRAENIAKGLDYGESRPSATVLDYAKALKQKTEADNVINAYNAQRKQELLAEAIRATEKSDLWKDKKNGLAYARETQERNIFDIAGKADKEGAELVKRTYFDPIHKNEALGQNFLKEYRAKVKAMGLSEAESVLVQAYGEKLIDDERLKAYAGNTKNIVISNENGDIVYKRRFSGKKGDVNIDKVKQSVEEFKGIYSTMLDMANNALKGNGYPPIKGLKDYFPHFSTKKGIIETVLAKIGLDLNNTDTLPEDIAGLTHTFKPGKTWFASFLHRLGERTEFDAVYGFDSYVEGIKNVIFHTEDIQKLRALETALRTKHTEEVIAQKIKDIYAGDIPEGMKADEVQKFLEKSNSGRLNNYVINLSDYIEMIAGKKAFADRQAERDLGRGFYNVMRAMEGRVASNMISFNVGSWLTNFIPLAQSTGQIGIHRLLKGMGKTLKSYVKNDGFASTSDFLINRKGSERISAGGLEKVIASGVKPMEWIDSFVTQSITRAKYYEGIAEGLSHDNAMQKANETTANIVADRSYGALPTIFNRKSPFWKLFTMFQVEVNNQFSNLLKDIPREAKAKGVAWLVSAIMQYMIASFAYNELYEWLVGRRPALDPIGVALQAFKDYNNKNMKKSDASLNLTQNVLEQMPFVGGLLNGGRVPVSAAIPFAGSITDASKGLAEFADDEIAGEYKGQLVAKELTKPLWYLAMPGGGGAVKKVVEGLTAVNAGGDFSYNKKGESSLKYAIDKTPENYAKATLFGKYSTQGGKEYIKNGFDGLNVNQTFAYNNLVKGGITPQKAQEIVKTVSKQEPDISVDGVTIEGSKQKKQMRRIKEYNLPKELTYGLYKDMLFNDEFAEKADTATNDFKIDKGKFIDIYNSIYDVKGIKDENGKTVANTAGLQKKDILTDAKLDEKQQAYLYEVFNVGKKVTDGTASWDKIKQATGVDYKNNQDEKIVSSSSGSSVANSAQGNFIKAAEGIEIPKYKKETLAKIADMGITVEDYAYIDSRFTAQGDRKLEFLQGLGLPKEQLNNVAKEFLLSATAKKKMNVATDLGIANELYVEAYMYSWGTVGNKGERNEQIYNWVESNNKIPANAKEQMYEWLKVSRGRTADTQATDGVGDEGGSKRTSGGRRAKGGGRSSKKGTGAGKLKADKTAELLHKKSIEKSRLDQKHIKERIALLKKKPSGVPKAVNVGVLRPKINLAEHKARMAGFNVPSGKTINGYRDIRPDVSKMLAGRTYLNNAAIGESQEKDVIANSNLLGKYKNLLGGKK